MNDLAGHARGLLSLPPSLGPVRLVAIDGHAGSGKSTLATRIAAALDGAPLLRLDDLATHEELFAWTDRLREQVLLPLSRGERARYAPYDWNARCFGPERPLDPAPVVLIEGVGAGRRFLRPRLASLWWMELDRETAWERGRRRDGPALGGFWDGWTVAEAEHFAGDPSRPYADSLVRQLPDGYEWLTGPQATPPPSRIATEGEGGRSSG
ncbi:uridine kinase [Streptomyces sp. NBC_00102]|uniref:uridine kinase family protein n=1 Tax=Streptomyces sp. NBC_00102 TaxID=2975652 RepID=UPI00224FFF4D|nr:hypothetical protein [Streptomyces sp. NBC_00102]MCX5395810.1 hypothetical protein [Streptomyces sp. NBC_00102]